MHIAATIRERIAQALATLDIIVEPENVTLEFPADLSHGDYATSVALSFAKQAEMAPRALAEKIVAALGEVPGVSSIEIAGPGFINFTLAPSAIAETIREAHGAEWGKGDAHAGETIMVEYTDPNPFKEFHIGHLMSNAIGESISRLLEYSGARIRRANWQGDVGPHVAKAIWGKMQRPDLAWGAAYAYGSEQYESHKSEIDAINKKVYEKNDPAVQKLYDEGRAESLAHFEELYAILGTKFDYYFFEGAEGLAGAPVVREFLDKGVFEESDGAIVFKGEKYGLHTRVFLTSQGLPTYEAKEIGLTLAKFAREPNLHESVVITANEQSDYFAVVMKAIECIFPDLARRMRHISHGMMRFAEGKMSSRKGNVVTGEALLHELTDAAKARAAESRADNHEKLAAQIAVAAIKFQVLKQQSSKDIIFDRERALSLEGDSGPYLQYTHARARAILEKAREQDVESKIDDGAAANETARLLVRFPYVVARAARELEPHHVAQYLLALSGAFNSWYAQEQFLDGTAAAAHKVAITDAVRATLARGLWLLGIPAPEKM